ncbi:MAG: hypothetical protein HFJ12_03605 [Bacilli bacterium]|nr:hypothetical protein [Bacilli bacterium]
MSKIDLLGGINSLIDCYPVKNQKGITIYVDEVTYMEKLRETEEKNKRTRESLQELLRTIRKDNPLNYSTYSHCPSSFLFHSSMEDYDDDCIDTKGGVNIVDDFQQAANKRRQIVNNRSFSLKRIVATVGVAIGLIAAVKNVSNYILDSNHHVRVEAPAKPESDIGIIRHGEQTKSGIIVSERATRGSVASTISIGDSFQLDDTQLYYSSDGLTPCVQTKELACDCYKINRIAILSHDGKKIIKTFNMRRVNPSMDIEEFKENCRLLYGEDINFKINVNGVIDDKAVFKQVGWTSMEHIKMQSKGKVYQKI